MKDNLTKPARHQANPARACRPLVIGVGEVLWDLLPGGRQLGGAPANFTYHAQALGADALLVSRVGDDPLGRELLASLRDLGLSVAGIGVDPCTPTGTVGVALDANGQPAFTIAANVAWDVIEATEFVRHEAARAAAICFGTLAQRSPVSRAAVRTLLATAPKPALRVCDLNLRQQYWTPELLRECLELADVLKLNQEELVVVAKLLDWAGGATDQIRRLAQCFELQAVALTKGPLGSELLIGGELCHCPGSKLTIVDTVGAGDSYTAALTCGLLAGDAPESILEAAHTLAEFVCTQPGAMPPLPERLQSCGDAVVGVST